MMRKIADMEEIRGNVVFNPCEDSLDPLTSFTTFSYSIESGMNNTIIVPSSIFTNSYFYQHEIAEKKGATNWPNLTFYGDNASADDTTAHISGIITGNLTRDEVSFSQLPRRRGVD